MIVAVISALVASVAWWAERPEQGVRRFSDSNGVKEDDPFKKLLKPAPVKEPIKWAPEDWRDAHVSVYSFRPTPPAVHLPTLRDLADSGQAHAIDFLARDSASTPHKWAELQQALSDASAAANQDPFEFDRVLVATVTKGTDWDLGDRMIWTRVFVQPINFEFAGYTVAATDNATEKVASVESTRGGKISADLALTVPGLEGPKADLAPSADHTVKTTSDVTTQYERLGVDITPGFLRIIRESEAGGDVLGNSTLSLSIVTDPATIRKNYPDDPSRPAAAEEVLLVTGTRLQDDAADLDDDKASITALPNAVLPHCPLKARVWMLYEQRHITDGAQFYDESRQTITLLRRADAQRDVEIVSADDVAPAVWHIQILPGETGVTDAAKAATKDAQDSAAGKLLQARVEDGAWRDIVFTDYGEASRLAHWLRNKYKSKLGVLNFNYPHGASLVPFKVTNNDCDRAGKASAAAGTYRAKPTTE